MRRLIPFLIIITLLLAACASLGAGGSGDRGRSQLLHRGLVLEYDRFECDGMGLVMLKGVAAWPQHSPEQVLLLDEFPYPHPCADFD